MALIDISGIDRAELFATLYNNAKPFGFGQHSFRDEVMTADDACEILKSEDKFDYFRGRLMKIQFTGDNLLDDWGYDRTYGVDKVQSYVNELRDANRPLTAMRPIRLKTPGM